MPDTGCWMLDAGYWILDVWVLCVGFCADKLHAIYFDTFHIIRYLIF